MGILGDVANLIGIGASAKGQHEANKTNYRIFKEGNAFSERMSNTAYQRAVKDMSAAGLNPMLAYSQGGASSPSSGGATMQNELSSFDGLGDSAARVSSASESRKLTRQQAEVARAQIDQVDAQTANIQAQTRKTNMESNVLEAQSPYSAFNAEMSAKKLSAEVTILGNNIKEALHKSYSAELDETQKRDLMPYVLEYQKLMNAAAKAGLPAKEAEAKFFETVPEAKWLAIVRQVLGK